MTIGFIILILFGVTSLMTLYRHVHYIDIENLLDFHMENIVSLMDVSDDKLTRPYRLKVEKHTHSYLKAMNWFATYYRYGAVYLFAHLSLTVICLLVFISEGNPVYITLSVVHLSITYLITRLPYGNIQKKAQEQLNVLETVQNRIIDAITKKR